jgi:hypothetical protein
MAQEQAPGTESEAPQKSAGPRPAQVNQSAGTHLRVSLMPWNNTSGTATSGVIIIGLIIAIPIIVAIAYGVFGSDKSDAAGAPANAAERAK